MIWLYLFLGIGVLNYVVYVIRTRLWRERRPHKIADRIEEAVVALFSILFWWVQVLFALIYVPIHDYLAGRAWKRAIKNGEIPWVEES